MHSYRAFSLGIHSDLTISPLQVISHAEDYGDVVRVRLGAVSEEGLSNPLAMGLCYQIKADAFWLNVPNMGRFLVTDGKEIVIEPQQGIDDKSLSAFLLGPCMAALLIQRNVFLLQATALGRGHQGFAILGRAQTGKSTLAHALVKRGYTFLSDNLGIINPQLELIPSFPTLYLWQKNRWYHQFARQRREWLRPGIKKYAVAMDRHFQASSLPLTTLFIVNPDKQTRETRTTQLTGGEKIRYLQKHIANDAYVIGLEKQALYFQYCAKIAANVNLILIDLPIQRQKDQRIIDLIESNWSVEHAT